MERGSIRQKEKVNKNWHTYIHSEYLLAYIYQLYNHVYFSLFLQSRRQLRTNGDGKFVVINMNWRLAAASDNSTRTHT